jgi:hypothetical protein
MLFVVVSLQLGSIFYSNLIAFFAGFARAVCGLAQRKGRGSEEKIGDGHLYVLQ